MQTIVAPLLAHHAGLLGLELAAEAHIVVIGDGLGTDEAAGEIRMNGAGGVDRVAFEVITNPGQRGIPWGRR